MFSVPTHSVYMTFIVFMEFKVGYNISSIYMFKTNNKKLRLWTSLTNITNIINNITLPDHSPQVFCMTKHSPVRGGHFFNVTVNRGSTQCHLNYLQ